MSTKRPRHSSPSGDSSSSSSSSLPGSPTTKIARTSGADGKGGSGGVPLICQLPPTCSKNPTYHSTTRDMEIHYATHHAHVCEYSRCHCVFPDDRFLQLHLVECHDPLTQIKKERGEKTFACFVATCTRKFMTPKARRLHLIELHGYPKQFFFAVTNKGIGGLLTRWGDSATMLRKEWKERAAKEGEGGDKDTDSIPVRSVGGENEDDDEEMREDGHEDMDMEPAKDVEGLAAAMGELSLVPTTIHFGVGSRQVGFVRQRTLSAPSPSVRFAQEDTIFEIPNRHALRGRGRGRGGRGKGRGRGRGKSTGSGDES